MRGYLTALLLTVMISGGSMVRGAEVRGRPATKPALTSLPTSGPSATAAGSQPRDIERMSEGKAYEYAFGEFAAGRQSSAEHLAAQRLAVAPAERRMRFFAGTLARSRFDKAEPAEQFGLVVRQRAGDDYARAAIAVVMLDRRMEVERYFATLADVVEKHPNEPLFLWLLAIESREYDRNEQGVICYRRLCEIVKPGGSLIHQTFANVLDGMKLYPEALEHRQLAVELEPASWSYNGLGNTLRMLERHKEACDAYAQAARLDQTSGRNYSQWAASEAALEHHEAAIEKCNLALACGYQDAWTYECKARALIKLNRRAEAAQSLREGLVEYPGNEYLLKLLKWLE